MFLVGVDVQFVRDASFREGCVPGCRFPEVISVDLTRRRAVPTVMPGRHGQELIDGGCASQVLAAAGRTLRLLHDSVLGLVHGDCGPQNLLFDMAAWQVSAVPNWEFADEGDPGEDLAWTEV